jgi:hypothetical protein
MIEPVYSDEEKANILLASFAIRNAQTKLRQAAEYIEVIAHHDREYGGWGLEPYKQVMWLVGEDAAGAVPNENGDANYMDDIIKMLDTYAK